MRAHTPHIIIIRIRACIRFVRLLWVRAQACGRIVVTSEQCNCTVFIIVMIHTHTHTYSMACIAEQVLCRLAITFHWVKTKKKNLFSINGPHQLFYACYWQLRFGNITMTSSVNTKRIARFSDRNFYRILLKSYPVIIRKSLENHRISDTMIG